MTTAYHTMSSSYTTPSYIEVTIDNLIIEATAIAVGSLTAVLVCVLLYCLLRKYTCKPRTARRQSPENNATVRTVHGPRSATAAVSQGKPVTPDSSRPSSYLTCISGTRYDNNLARVVADGNGYDNNLNNGYLVTEQKEPTAAEYAQINEGLDSTVYAQINEVNNSTVNTKPIDVARDYEILLPQRNL